VDNYTPNAGSIITYTIIVTDHGPAETADVIVISDTLPVSVTYVSSDTTQGGYDPASGVWDVGALFNGDSAALHVAVEVNAGAAGQTITNTAVVSDSRLTDLFPDNDASNAFIVAQAANAVMATVTPGEGGDLDCGATIEVPANAVTDGVTLLCTPASAPDAIPSGWLFAGHAFNLDAYLEGVFQPGFAFTKPVTIAVHYSDESVAGLNEDELVLRYWNGDTSEWENAVCGEYEYHSDENWLAVPICHLTPFALLGSESAFPVGGVTLVTSSWLWLALAALVATGAIAAAALKRRAAKPYRS
jgi:uncharacterized repeat protein (TIGR01451 family)